MFHVLVTCCIVVITMTLNCDYTCHVLQQILQRTGKLFESGSSLESHPHANQEAVIQLMGKVKHLMGDFDRRLSFRKKKLNDSVRLHQLTEAVSSLSLSLSLSFPLPSPFNIRCLRREL